VWKDIETHASPQHPQGQRRKRRRTAWRSHSGTMKLRDVKIRNVRKEKDEDVIKGARKERKRSAGGEAKAEPLRNLTATTLMMRMTRTTPLAEEEQMVRMTEMAVVMVIASATKKTVMEDKDAGTAAMTGRYAKSK
jgi:hypothetical protein